MNDTTLTFTADILKGEALPLSRVVVPAAQGTKKGTPVKYPLRDKYLLALTDEVNGEVVIQPHNCVINLDGVQKSALVDSNSDPISVETLQEEGDAFGIVYIGKPQA